MRRYWDPLQLLQYAPGEGDGGDEGDGKGGDGGSGGTGAGNGNGNQQKPPWADEFGEQFDPAKAWDLITNLRTSERTLKTENRSLGTKVKTFEDASKSDTEKTQAELEALRSENEQFKRRERESNLRNQVAEEARKLGAIYPDDLFRLLGDETLTVDEHGKISNLTKVLTDFRTARPALFNSRNIDQHSGRDTSNPPNSNDFNAVIRRSAGRA